VAGDLHEARVGDLLDLGPGHEGRDALRASLGIVGPRADDPEDAGIAPRLQDREDVRVEALVRVVEGQEDCLLGKSLPAARRIEDLVDADEGAALRAKVIELADEGVEADRVRVGVDARGDVVPAEGLVAGPRTRGSGGRGRGDLFGEKPEAPGRAQGEGRGNGPRRPSRRVQGSLRSI